MRDSDHTKAVSLLVGAALCWSLGGVLLKSVDWPPFAVGGGRGLIAAIFLLLVTGRSLKFKWGVLPIATAVAYTGCTVLFAAATKLTTAANAILLQYTAPVYVALLAAWLLKERPRRADWITMALVFIGMAIFFYDGLRLNDLAGILLAIASGISFAFMIVLLRMQKDGAPLGSIILGNFMAFFIGLPSMIGAPFPDTGSIMALLLLGIVQLGFAYLLYARAIRHVTALEGVLIPVVEPILNPLWVMLVIGEKPSPLALFGGSIVLGAVTWRAITSIRRPPPEALAG
ncbi:MAG: EamA family transporter [Candidatus Didemnitutus sp.]|nr:EamA family transporter [Candidatus Didemnitutus sp.]